jgi:hypothetical protein
MRYLIVMIAIALAFSLPAFAEMSADENTLAMGALACRNKVTATGTYPQGYESCASIVSRWEAMAPGVTAREGATLRDKQDRSDAAAIGAVK